MRRFDRLHCRVLLKLQDQLTCLEKRLDDLDNAWAHIPYEDGVDRDNSTLRLDDPERKTLLEEIQQKLQEYGETKFSASSIITYITTRTKIQIDSFGQGYVHLKERQSAPQANVRNVKQWLQNNKGAIDPDESSFINWTDVFTVSKPGKSSVRRFFEQQILYRVFNILGLGPKSGTAPGPFDPGPTTVQGDDSQVDILATISVFSAAAVMLIAPLWILAVLHDMFRKLVVITVFSIFFLVVMNWGTVARPFEILAATAGQVSTFKLLFT